MSDEVMEGGAESPSDPRLPTAIYYELGEWRDRAACRKMGNNMFFAQNENGEHRYSLIKEAQKVCAKCPVIAECLNYAVQNKERYGVWGGVSFFVPKRKNKQSA